MVLTFLNDLEFRLRGTEDSAGPTQNCRSISGDPECQQCVDILMELKKSFNRNDANKVKVDEDLEESWKFICKMTWLLMSTQIKKSISVQEIQTVFGFTRLQRDCRIPSNSIGLMLESLKHEDTLCRSVKLILKFFLIGTLPESSTESIIATIIKLFAILESLKKHLHLHLKEIISNFISSVCSYYLDLSAIFKNAEDSRVITKILEQFGKSSSISILCIDILTEKLHSFIIKIGKNRYSREYLQLQARLDEMFKLLLKFIQLFSLCCSKMKHFKYIYSELQLDSENTDFLKINLWKERILSFISAGSIHCQKMTKTAYRCNEILELMMLKMVSTEESNNFGCFESTSTELRFLSLDGKIEKGCDKCRDILYRFHDINKNSSERQVPDSDKSKDPYFHLQQLQILRNNITILPTKQCTKQYLKYLRSMSSMVVEVPVDSLNGEIKILNPHTLQSPNNDRNLEASPFDYCEVNSMFEIVSTFSVSDIEVQDYMDGNIWNQDKHPDHRSSSPEIIYMNVTNANDGSHNSEDSCIIVAEHHRRTDSRERQVESRVEANLPEAVRKLDLRPQKATDSDLVLVSSGTSNSTDLVTCTPGEEICIANNAQKVSRKRKICEEQDEEEVPPDSGFETYQHTNQSYNLSAIEDRNVEGNTETNEFVPSSYKSGFELTRQLSLEIPVREDWTCFPGIPAQMTPPVLCSTADTFKDGINFGNGTETSALAGKSLSSIVGAFDNSLHQAEENFSLNERRYITKSKNMDFYLDSLRFMLDYSTSDCNCSVTGRKIVVKTIGDFYSALRGETEGHILRKMISPYLESFAFQGEEKETSDSELFAVLRGFCNFYKLNILTVGYLFRNLDLVNKENAKEEPQQELILKILPRMDFIFQSLLELLRILYEFCKREDGDSNYSRKMQVRNEIIQNVEEWMETLREFSTIEAHRCSSECLKLLEDIRRTVTS